MANSVDVTGTLALILLALCAVSNAQPEPYGELIRLDGHLVHMHCQGQGTPIVLLLHGTPRFSFHFALVIPEVARLTRVCVYDRAGDAWSEPVPGQPTARIFIDELDRVARYVSPAAPVILAGHSVGGLLARAYYAQHPERVAAMVLIDTAPPILPRVSPARRSAAALPDPTLTPPFDNLPARFHEAHLWATNKWVRYAASVDHAQANQFQTELYAMAARAISPTLPIWFLSRAAAASSREVWFDTQQRMASLWGNSTLVRVAPSGHDIELEHPGAVALAIAQAVRSARANAE